MAEHFDSYFSQVAPQQIGSDLLVDYFGPKLQTYANGLQFEISSIPEETETIKSYFHQYEPGPADTIFDIGAYCGVSSYYFSQLVPLGKVVAFEPDPLNYELLVRNVQRHHLKNVVPVHCAIGGSSGVAPFFSEGAMGSSLKRQSSRATVGRIQHVRVLSFEQACEDYGIPEFVKVDIEGSEIEMIAAAQPFLRREAIYFALDTNHWTEGRGCGELTASIIEQLFRECGYDAHSSAEFGFLTTWAKPFDQAQARWRSQFANQVGRV